MEDANEFYSGVAALFDREYIKPLYQKYHDNTLSCLYMLRTLL
jgi:hypothetical protein